MTASESSPAHDCIGIVILKAQSGGFDHVPVHPPVIDRDRRAAGSAISSSESTASLSAECRPGRDSGPLDRTLPRALSPPPFSLPLSPPPPSLSLSITPISPLLALVHRRLGKPVNSSRWRGGRLDGAEGAISTKQNTCLY